MVAWYRSELWLCECTECECTVWAESSWTAQSESVVERRAQRLWSLRAATLNTQHSTLTSSNRETQSECDSRAECRTVTVTLHSHFQNHFWYVVRPTLNRPGYFLSIQMAAMHTLFYCQSFPFPFPFPISFSFLSSILLYSTDLLCEGCEGSWRIAKFLFFGRKNSLLFWKFSNTISGQLMDYSYIFLKRVTK